MDFPQSLYSQRIYRVNKTIENLKEAFELEKYFVGFDTLNYYTLKFNWYAVDKKRWSFGSDIINNIKDCYDIHKDKWGSLFSQLIGLNRIALNESMGEFKSEMGKRSLDAKRIHYHLMNMYQSYPIDSDKFLAGVIYRNFKSFRIGNKRLSYAKGTFLTGTEYNGTYTIYPWIRFQFVFRDCSEDEAECFLCCQEKAEDLPLDDCNGGNSKARGKTPGAISDRENIYFHYIVPLLVRFKDPVEDSKSFNGKVAKIDGANADRYLFSTEDIKKGISGFEYILCIPVYDAVIADSMYGNFYGNLTFLFSSNDGLNNFVKAQKSRFEEMACFMSMAKADPTLR